MMAQPFKVQICQMKESIIVMCHIKTQYSLLVYYVTTITFVILIEVSEIPIPSKKKNYTGSYLKWDLKTLRSSQYQRNFYNLFVEPNIQVNLKMRSLKTGFSRLLKQWPKTKEHKGWNKLKLISVYDFSLATNIRVLLLCDFRRWCRRRRW